MKLFAVFAAVLVATPGVNAVAEKPSGSGIPVPGSTSAYLASADLGLLARQEGLMKFKTWLIELPGIKESGFVESANSAATNSTTLLWVGSSPLQEAARKEAAARGITLTIKPVRHTNADLQQATDAVWASQKSAQWNGFVIHAVVGTDTSHDGIIVEGHYGSGVSAAEARNRLTAATTYAKSLTDAVTDVRITPAPVNTDRSDDADKFGTRSNDIAPFSAGGMMRALGPAPLGHCTNGFAIWWRGLDWTTTARHCNNFPFRVWDSSWLEYGRSAARQIPGVGAIVLLGRGGYHWMFDGPWDEPTGYHKTVVGFADLSEGDLVCTSGAMSGVHCDVEVVNLRFSHYDGQGHIDTISARRNGVAVAGGDSGGPALVAYSENGWTTVGAAGLLQWGQVEEPCGSTRMPTTCFSRVGFSSMRALVEELGEASLRTG